MNGEPRDAASSTSDHASAAIRPASGLHEAGLREAALHEADRPLLPAIKSDGVTKTPITEDGKLAPLFRQDVAADFRSRWDVVQRSFVDNPQEAVRAGDELVAQVIKSLAETFASQRSGPEDGRENAEESTTENLRLSLRRYRSFFERLLSI
jgi:hypothetical protein